MASKSSKSSSSSKSNSSSKSSSSSKNSVVKNLISLSPSKQIQAAKTLGAAAQKASANKSSGSSSSSNSSKSTKASDTKTTVRSNATANRNAAVNTKTANGKTSTKSSGSSSVTGAGSVAGFSSTPSLKSLSSGGGGGSYYYTPSTAKSGSYSSPSSAVQSSGGSTTTKTTITNGKKAAGSRNTSKQETTTTFDDLTGETVGIANTDLGTTNTKTKEEKDAEITGTNKDESEGFDELTGEVAKTDQSKDTINGKYYDPRSGLTFKDRDQANARWDRYQYNLATNDERAAERAERRAAEAAKAKESEAAKASEAAKPVAFNQWGQRHAQGPVNNSATNPQTDTYQNTMTALTRLGLRPNAATMGTPLSPTVTAGEQNSYNNANSLADTYMKKFDTLAEGGVAGDVASNAAYTYTDFLKQLNNYRNANGMGQDEYNNLLNKIKQHPIWKSLSGNRQ